ncbi:MAG: DOMON-like domain-containing protein [Desulfatiglans sp.]|nr:DOMON-like domain-containing protein [Desulfatiglans sp.]
MKQEKLIREFNLQPFPEKAQPEECRINVKIIISPESLHITFELRTRSDTLFIPLFDPSTAKRTDNLWAYTCFEIFIGSRDGEAYREFNLSPSGAWNVYLFKGYREDMQTDQAFTSLPFDVHVIPERGLDLTVEIDNELVPITADTLIGLSAVLEHSTGIKTYWAIRHPKSTPDFHAKEGWVSL